MWGQVCLLWTLLWVAWSAPSTICPENCKCNSIKQNHLEAHCTNLDFVQKLRPRQITEIVSLDLKSRSLKKLDHKLKKLKNLQSLDLSDNKFEDLKHFPHLTNLVRLSLRKNNIKQFTADILPKSLQHLDLSSNIITTIPDISKNLPNLKELNLNDNNLFCDCELVKVRDALMQNGVHIVRSPICNLPENVEGKSLLAVYCVNGNVMYDGDDFVGDQGFGSGVDPVGISAAQFDNDQNIEDDQIEPDYFPSSSNNASNSLEEGSGDEQFLQRIENEYGSGDSDDTTPIIVQETNVRNCFFDCSTLPPLEEDPNRTQTSIIEDINKFIVDLSGGPNLVTTVEPVTEAPVLKETIPQVLAPIREDPGKPVHDDMVRRIQINEAPKELEKKIKDDNQYTTFIVVGVLLVLMAGLIFYFVYKKKRSGRPNNRLSSDVESEKPAPVEMAPLVKPNETNDANNVAEKSPLINGQNGTRKDEEGKEDEDDEDVVDGDVEMRSKNNDDELLTPETKRVTIQEKEFSSPKTPVFVHRHLSDDGRIITTPTHDH